MLSRSLGGDAGAGRWWRRPGRCGPPRSQPVVQVESRLVVGLDEQHADGRAPLARRWSSPASTRPRPRSPTGEVGVDADHVDLAQHRRLVKRTAASSRSRPPDRRARTSSKPAGSNHGSAMRSSNMARVMSPWAGWWAKARRLTSTTASWSAGRNERAQRRSVRSPDRQRARASGAAPGRGRGRARAASSAWAAVAPGRPEVDVAAAEVGDAMRHRRSSGAPRSASDAASGGRRPSPRPARWARPASGRPGRRRSRAAVPGHRPPAGHQIGRSRRRSPSRGARARRRPSGVWPRRRGPTRAVNASDLPATRAGIGLGQGADEGHDERL